MLIALDSRRAIYQQIYERLREGIVSGELAPAARLPSTRALATELGVARRTALVAYEQLLAEGYVVGRVGSGTTVAPELNSSRILPRNRAAVRGARRIVQLGSFGRRLANSVQPSVGMPRGPALRYD